MRYHLRLALPPLADFHPRSPLCFALFNRRGRLLRGGELPLNALASQLPTRAADVILYPGDAVVTTVDIPPVAARHIDAAVQARIEPLVLGDPAALCVAYGRRNPEGRIPVAWASRPALQRAWRMLNEAGLQVRGLHAIEMAVPDDGPAPPAPLALPVDARWQTPLPPWSLARPEWQPEQPSRQWLSALRWSVAAAVLWVAGLQMYAAQLRAEVDELQEGMVQRVQAAFPAISAVLDPLRQTQMQLDQLRLTQGSKRTDDFLPLALDAARILDFAADHVTALDYAAGQLSLTLADTYSPPANELALERQATAAGVQLYKDPDHSYVWHLRRATGVERETHP